MDIEESERFSQAVIARLKEERLKGGLSQAALAEAAGLSRTAITMIESGQRRPTLMVCHALAKALGLALSNVISDVE